MGELIYSAICSVDGYTEDKEGKFDWATPDAEVHRFVNDLERGAGTYLYGRRMYEMMAPWETDPRLAADSAEMRDYAHIWQAADKLVFSTALEKVWTARTRLERAFDPEAIRRLKASSGRDISVGGPTLAAHAFRAGLVDQCYLFLVPVSVGGGKRSLPDDARLMLELLDERRFHNGTVFLHYRVRP